MQRYNLWVVGDRVTLHSSLSHDGSPIKLLPPHHPDTAHFMSEAHISSGHGGRDATLVRFRSKYYTSHASKSAQSVCQRCQCCRLACTAFLKQSIGQLPPENWREVQKRMSGNEYGVSSLSTCPTCLYTSRYLVDVIPYHFYSHSSDFTVSVACPRISLVILGLN